jgi:hypothetical protein
MERDWLFGEVTEVEVVVQFGFLEEPSASEIHRVVFGCQFLLSDFARQGLKCLPVSTGLSRWNLFVANVGLAICVMCCRQRGRIAFGAGLRHQIFAVTVPLEAPVIVKPISFLLPIADQRLTRASFALEVVVLESHCPEWTDRTFSTEIAKHTQKFCGNIRFSEMEINRHHEMEQLPLTERIRAEINTENDLDDIRPSSVDSALFALSTALKGL